jgi:hypothetical protein
MQASEVRAGGRSAALARGEYRGFISYSHADARMARWLHRAMESYRLPRALAIIGQDGARIDRLGPVFRDRDDFPVAVDLSEAVRKALTRAQALIVLCSPEAKASYWVGQEIQLFRALFPDRPIMAVLLRGEPETAFPDALIAGGEPLAADLRPGKDGRRLGLLKIVAGLLDLPLDALVQRDAQRNLRRVMAVTLAAFTLLIIMAAMTITAIRARNDAVRQRAEAEGLIEYMLTDLRADLRHVGRLDVMTDVNRRALRYYQNQGELRTLPADSLDRRARILHAMGEDDGRQGKAGSARHRFAEAYGVTREQLRRAPGDGGRLFAHAQSAYWLGFAGYRAGNWAMAARYWTEYRRLAGLLAAAEPGSRRAHEEVGYAEGNLCTLALARAATAGNALPHCRSALSSMQHVARLSGNTAAARSAVANRRAWLADGMIARGDLKGGIGELRLQERELRALVAERPRDFDLLDQWTRALMVLSEHLRDIGRMGEARALHDRARRGAEKLTAQDPSNGNWKRTAERIGTFDHGYVKGRTS